MSTTYAGSPLQEGDVVAGSYIVEKVIGAGGMAFVALASHTEAHHRVAIKILRAENARRGEVVKRFEREQRTLATLHSEHTLRIYGFAQHAGLPYMLLEYLKGNDLGELVKREGPLPIERAVEYTLQACHAIAEAHLLGIVHRDLKPGNLFLTRRTDGSPCIKVLDFGISKVSHELDGLEEPSLVTVASAVMGSPFYMPPEQMISSATVDARSDIWSLGVTLFEILTKSLPFAADSAPAVCHRIMSGEPTPLRKLRPNYPKGLEATIQQCLQRRPENRFANIADFAVKLGDFAPAHSQYAIKSICELVPPSAPYVLATPNQGATVPLPEGESTATGGGNGDTTVYLPHGEAGSKGFPTAALVVATGVAFGLGVGAGWLLNLDTDPTHRKPTPEAASTGTAKAATPAVPGNPRAAAATAATSDAIPTAATTIDLDGTTRPNSAGTTVRGNDGHASPSASGLPTPSSTLPPKEAPRKVPAVPNVTF